MARSMIILGAILVWFSSCHSDSNQKTKQQTTLNTATVETVSPEIELVSIHNEDGTWGYDIFLGGKHLIHQPHLPAVGGVKGFDKEITARKAGELMIMKLTKGIMPPSLKKSEVDSLIRNFDK